MTTVIQILRDFKPILDLDLYGEHMPEERITGSKIDHDLSARSTYTRVYTVLQGEKCNLDINKVSVNLNLIQLMYIHRHTNI